MKFLRLDLLTLLISLFLLNSCKNQDNLGLVVDPSQQITGVLIDSSTIQTNTVLEDSVVTNGLTRTPLAYFKDPIIGISEANMVAGLGLPGGGSSYTLPSGTVTIDSAVLILRYSNPITTTTSTGANANNDDIFYGDSLTSKFKVNIFQLAEKPAGATIYYSNKTWNVSNVLLGSQVFNSRTRTPIKITDIVTGKPDTLKTVGAQIRVKLTPSFFASNLFNASAAVLGSTTLFQNQVKGLYITLDKSQQQGAGGRFFIRPDSSRVDIYYKALNPTTSVVDTAIVSLPFSTTAAEVRHTFSTAVTAALNTTTPQETFYLDGLGGLRTRIAFPYLKNIINTIGTNSVINRAELVITPVPGSNISYNATRQLTMYRFDIAKQRALLPDDIFSSTGAAGDPRAISAATFAQPYNYYLDNSYHFIITGYISDLLRGKTIDYGTFIAPSDPAGSSSVPINATVQVASRLFGVGGVTNKASANYPYRMKLNIIYTKATQ